MTRLALLVVAAAMLLAACGGASPTGGGGTETDTPDGDTAAPATPGASVGAPSGGDLLTPDDIAAAFAATEALGSWTFEANVYAPTSGGDLVITGTERRQPERAVAAVHSTPNGDFGYVRIGDDIWYDVATGEWTRVDAASAANLIRQYEPFHLAALVEMAVATRFYEYEFVAEEDANGVPSRHYRLSESDREKVTQPVGLTPDQWAGDVWVATDGGYLVRYRWGPQSFEVLAATGGVGFSYDATSFGCECPIEPPV